MGEPDEARACLDVCIPIFQELRLRAEEQRAHAIFEELGLPEDPPVR
jgi:hypothetical protein